MELSRHLGKNRLLSDVLKSNAHDDVVAALLSDGDSRILLDPASRTNKYLCPPRPVPELACFASCTASPIGQRGFERASQTFHDIRAAASPQARAERLAQHRHDIAARVLRYFGASDLAEAILCPSGTDAMLTAAMMLAAERPGEPARAILPCAAETGTGVPLAAACRQFDGPGCGAALSRGIVDIVEIPLRDAAGAPRAEAELNDAFAAAAAKAGARAVIYLTHSTKTGLVAPMAPPACRDVIVDACQARIAPETVAAYLAQEWPVVVTGSKFLGGPAFAGAVLLPRARFGQPHDGNGAGLGTVLRWSAAVAEIETFELRAAGMATKLRGVASMVARGLAGVAAAVPVEGLRPCGPGWADRPSIFTFAVRDPEAPARLLPMAGLRPLHQRLARQGVLLGQPVDLGPFGGLRIAVGARHLVEGAGDAPFHRLFDTLAAALPR